MTIQVSSLGPNSSSISYSADTAPTEIHDALVSSLQGFGWTVYDPNQDTLTDNTTVMMALCADGTSPKYLAVRVADPFVYMEVYETWSTATHSGTNMAHNSDQDGYAQRLSLPTGGLIYMFASVRYAFIQSVLSSNTIGASNGKGFCGIAEVSRDNSEEVPGDAPLFVWLNSYLFLGHGGHADTTSYLYSWPRLPAALGNGTGADASRYTHTSSIFGCSINSTETYNFCPKASNPLSTSGHNFVTNINAMGYTPAFFIRGRFYGLKQLATNIGMNMDTISMRVDTELFYSGNGQNVRDHFVLSAGSHNGRLALPY